MMKYNRTTKRYITAFESIFNNIVVTRQYAENTNKKVKVVKVPIEYAPGEKEFLLKKIQEDLMMTKPSMVYPRIAFDLTDMKIDNSRMVNQYNRYRSCVTDANNKVFQIEPPVPYNFTFSLYVFVDILDDAYEVVEGIMANFRPSVTIEVINELGLKTVAPVTIASITHEDTYEGESDKRRLIYYKVDFLMKADVYKIPDEFTETIKHIDLNFETVVVGDKETVNIDVVPETANINDNYQIVTIIE